MRVPPSAAARFAAGALRAVALDASDIARLQRIFEFNPEYFFVVDGRPEAPR